MMKSIGIKIQTYDDIMFITYPNGKRYKLPLDVVIRSCSTGVGVGAGLVTFTLTYRLPIIRFLLSSTMTALISAEVECVLRKHLQ